MLGCACCRTTTGSHARRRAGRSISRAGWERMPGPSATPSRSSRSTVMGTAIRTSVSGRERSTRVSTASISPTRRGSALVPPGSHGVLVEHQMAEGGRNREWGNGSTRSSFRSTLNNLRGIPRQAAQECLLERRLMMRLLTGSWSVRGSTGSRTRPDGSIARSTPTTTSGRLPCATERLQRRDWWPLERGSSPRPRVVRETNGNAGAPSHCLTFHATRTLRWRDAAHH